MIVARFIVCGGGPGSFAGPRLRVGLPCGETQEEHVWNLILRRSDVDDHGASGYPTEQELFALRAQVTARPGLAEAVQAINNLATAQVRKETPSLFDVKGLGRPKEFTGRDEDFQQWSKKTEAFFAGVIKESDMWPLNRRRKSRRQRLVSSSCRRTRTRTEERKTWSLCCSRCTQHSRLSRVMRRMVLSPTRGRIHWRHGGDCRSDMIRRQEEENETFYARSSLRDGALFWSSKRGSSNDGSPACLATRRR